MSQPRRLRRLRRLDDDIWAADHPLKMPGGLIIGTRMTAIRLSDGGLFLHSPVPLDDELRQELGELGPVRCIVAPNKLHYFSVTEHAEAFPEARVYDHQLQSLRKVQNGEGMLAHPAGPHAVGPPGSGLPLTPAPPERCGWPPCRRSVPGSEA